MITKSGSVIADYIQNFFDSLIFNKVEIYNEFSLQHELGIYLRARLPLYKVQFERNASYFGVHSLTIKREIDIAIFTNDKSERYAIELKCPLNGQYPEQMFSFIKDIKFMEQLKEQGFTNSFAVALVNSRPFYEGNNNEGIYKYFRKEYKVYGEIRKPTGKKDEVISISGIHPINWQSTGDGRRYYIVEV